MNMVIPDEGKLLALERWIAPDVAGGETWHIRIFKNNYTPDDDSTLASFTEATFTGYAQVDILESDWGAAAITAHVAYSTSGVTPVFTCTGGATQTIYGWYAVGATSGKVLAAQRFDTSWTMGPGASESLNPAKMAFKTFA